jgi:hypothetical protein
MVYNPAEFVVAVVFTAVATFSAVTIAPETRAPLGSVTCPVIDPVTVCARDVLKPKIPIRQTPTTYATNRLHAIESLRVIGD